MYSNDFGDFMWNWKLHYSSKRSSAQTMMGGISSPEAGNFGSRWVQNRNKANAPNAAARRGLTGVCYKKMSSTSAGTKL